MNPPKAYVCGLDDDTIRGIALDCGFKLKQQPDGTEDLNPYVYKFANEVLATMPSPEDVARFRNALIDTQMVKALQRAEQALSAFCDGDDWLGTMPGDALAEIRAAIAKEKP